MKTSIFLVTLLVFVTSTMVFAQSGQATVNAVEIATDTGSSVNGMPASTTTTLTVQKKSRPDPLTNAQGCAVEAYLIKHYDKKDAGNRAALRNALVYLLGIGQSHLPLGRTPKDYLADYQICTQLMEHTDLSVEMPAIPAFNGGGSQGSLSIDDVPAVEKSCAVAYTQPPGAMLISHPGSTNETPIAEVSHSWKNYPEQKVCPPQPPPPKPPTGPTCPPGNPPNKPPTDPGNNFPGAGEPSWIEPNQDLPPGYVAPGGPPPPTGDQAPVEIPSQPWNPDPTNSHVADPVN